MDFSHTHIAILIFWNLIAFAIMGIDKRLAIKRKWRIDEKTLFLLTFLFGGVGIFCGMYLFHHKTHHWRFRIFVPLGIITNVAALFFYFM
jgi:uncharacterized membrane protein YsdA (DUF1294 family)